MEVATHGTAQTRQMGAVVQCFSKIMCYGTYISTLRTFYPKMYVRHFYLFDDKRRDDNLSRSELYVFTAASLLVDPFSLDLYGGLARRQRVLFSFTTLGTS